MNRIIFTKKLNRILRVIAAISAGVLVFCASPEDVGADELLEPSVTLESITIRTLRKNESKGIPEDNKLYVGSGVVVEYDIVPEELRNKVTVTLSSSDESHVDINHQYNSVWGCKPGFSEITATAVYKEEGQPDQSVTSEPLKIEAVYPVGTFFDYYGICFATDPYTLYTEGWLSVKGKEYVTGVRKESGYDVYYFGDDPDQPYYHRAVKGERVIGTTHFFFDDNGKLIKEWIKLEKVELMPIADGSAKGVIAENTLSVGSRVMITAKLFPERTNDERNPEWTVSNPDVLKVTTCTPADARPDEIYAYVDVLRYPEDPDEPVTVNVSVGDEGNRHRTDDDPADDHSLQIYVTYPTGWQVIGEKTFYGEAVTVGGRTNVEFAKGWWPKDFDNRSEANKEYHFDETTGEMTTGIYEKDDIFYDFGEDGILCGEYEKKGFVKFPEGTMYFDDTGTRVYDSVVSDDNGDLWHIDDEGWLVTGPEEFFKCKGSWYYSGAKGKLAKGLLSLKRGGKTYKYYFDENAILVTGVTEIAGKMYYLREYSDAHSDSRDPSVNYEYGAVQFGTKGVIESENPEASYYVNQSGIIQTGWRFVSIGGKYTPEYYSSEDAIYGQKQVITALDGQNTGWYGMGGNLYYIAGGKTLKKGNVKLKLVADSDNKKDFLFCLDPVTGSYNGTEGPVNVAGKVYYNVKMEEPYKSLPGYPHTAVVLSGEYTFDGKTYYIDNNGALLRGWNRIKDTVTKKYVWRYFRTGDGAELTDPGFDDDNKMVKRPGEPDKDWWGTVTENGVTSKYYIKNGTALLKGGWQTIDGIKYYCDPSTGVVTVPVWHGNWAVFDDGSVFYYKNGKTLAKGVVSVAGTYEDPDDTTVSKFLFDSSTGMLKKASAAERYALFSVGSVTYEADSCGRLTTGWGYLYDDAGTPAVRTVTEHENIQSDSYYDENGRQIKKKYYTVTEGSSAGTYYFDEKGKMAEGISVINKKKYILGANKDDVAGKPGISKDRGKLYKNYYGELDGTDRKYLSDKNGAMLTLWQKVREGTGLRWHYFDALSGAEVPGTWEGDWYVINLTEKGRSVRAKFYFSSGGPVKGFKTINGRKYYFDSTGRLATGLWKIGNTTYYFNEKIDPSDPESEGELQKSDIYSVGSGSYFLTSTGAAKKGWFTDNKARYYADPATGKLAVGFKMIGGKVYYFADGGADLGKLQTGFIKLSYRQQIYYDKRDGASNLYYADEKGVICTGGWKNVKADPKLKDSQEWSYYLNPDRPGKDMGDFVLNGEVTVGDVLMDENGQVTFLDDGILTNDGFAVKEGVLASDITRYYRFDPITGARRKTVMYFYGNYYGMTPIDQDQVRTISTMSRYINTDMKYDSQSKDFIIVNGGVDFPRCASNSVDDEKESYKAQTTGGNDNDLNDDGHIDVLDTEIRSKALYDYYIEKYGTKNLVLMGSSSGAGICLGLYDYAISKNDPKKLPAQVLLISPWVDVSMGNTACAKLTKKQTGSTDLGTLKYWGARYTRDKYYEDESGKPYKNIAGEGVSYVFASPVRSRNKGKMKNVVMYTGTYDPCSFDCAVFTDYAKAAGNNDIILKKYTGQQHGFVFFGANKDAVAASVDACRRIMTE